MRKLVESTFVTLDGVIENPQNWSPPYWDEEHSAYAGKLLDSADALLLGRATYEGFAEAWPPRSGDMADRINSMPKHVASSTLKEATWNATIIDGDVAEEVAKLKEQPGGEIHVSGSGNLVQTLLRHDLVDEFVLLVFPVLVGPGKRLFGDGTVPGTLELVESTSTGTGVLINTYRRRGPLEVGAVGPEQEGNV
jgi:dihydrofolate reductase